MKNIFLCLLLLPLFVAAQDAPPDTDIWLIDMSYKNGKFTFGTPKNITNSPGYDNQPSFTRDNSAILYSSDNGGQTDIMVYGLEEEVSFSLGTTPESEYSPVEMHVKGGVSVVMVEADESQRLWGMTMEEHVQPLIEEMRDIGYYEWINDTLAAIWRLGEPPFLQVYNFKTKTADTIAINASRSFRFVPMKKKLIYIDKSAEEWQVMEYDVLTKKHSKITKTPGEYEDFAVAYGNFLLFPQDQKLLALDLNNPVRWIEVADFSETEIGPFYRIAVSPNNRKIAVVAYQGEKP